MELPDDKHQYIVSNSEINNNEDKYYCNWDEEMKIYTMQIYFKDIKV